MKMFLIWLWLVKAQAANNWYYDSESKNTSRNHADRQDNHSRVAFFASPTDELVNTFVSTSLSDGSKVSDNLEFSVRASLFSVKCSIWVFTNWNRHSGITCGADKPLDFSIDKETLKSVYINGFKTHLKEYMSGRKSENLLIYNW